MFIATSLDGFIARENGDIGWLTDPVASVDHKGATPPSKTGDYDALMKRVDHLVMGRGTYEKVLTFDSWPFDAIPVLVLSRSLAPDVDKRVTVVHSVDDAVTLLNERLARAVYVDGGRTIQSFLRDDLIDEITVTRAPVLIGSGLPLFGEIGSDIQLSLQSVAARAGLVHTHYRVVRG